MTVEQTLLKNSIGAPNVLGSSAFQGKFLVHSCFAHAAFLFVSVPWRAPFQECAPLAAQFCSRYNPKARRTGSSLAAPVTTPWLPKASAELRLGHVLLRPTWLGCSQNSIFRLML